MEKTFLKLKLKIENKAKQTTDFRSEKHLCNQNGETSPHQSSTLICLDSNNQETDCKAFFNENSEIFPEQLDGTYIEGTIHFNGMTHTVRNIGST